MKIKTLKQPTEAMRAMLVKAGNKRFEIAADGMRELAKALVLPLRQGVLKGDILSGIYESVKFQPGIQVEFPLDFLNPGSEKDFVAYTIPSQGRIPERHVQGDFVAVPTYDVGSSIDFALKYAEYARWDIVARALQVLEATMIRKNNDDGWRTILASAVGRGIVVYDDAATAGLFTKRSISLGKTIMRRNAGGNSTSTNKGKLTDLYLSPESLEDIRSWDLTQVDDFTRREIFLGGGDNDLDYSLTKVFGVLLHDIDEFGVSQVYQNYYSNVLGGTLPGGKTEVMIGLDLKNQDSFIEPVVELPEVFEDAQLHRQRRAGFYAWYNHGYTVLDARRVIALAV